MKLVVFSVAIAVGISACGGETMPRPGDPVVPGDPGSGTGDTMTGDPASGDAAGDSTGQGDEAAGDPRPGAVITPSTQLCAAGGAVSSSSYHGTVCLAPLGSGGEVSTSSSYKWIPGPAHMVEAE